MAELSSSNWLTVKHLWPPFQLKTFTLLALHFHDLPRALNMLKCWKWGDGLMMKQRFCFKVYKEYFILVIYSMVKLLLVYLIAKWLGNFSIPTSFDVINHKMSIHPFSSTYAIQGHGGGAGPYPSCLWVRGRVCPGQVASWSQNLSINPIQVLIVLQ